MFGLLTKQSRDSSDTRPSRIVSHMKSMLGGGLNVIYHMSTKVRREESHHGGVDRLTKYAHFCALSHPFKASTIDVTFMEIVKNLHGNQRFL